MVLKLNWSKLALNQLEKSCKYIMQDSLKNAQKVRRDIFIIGDSLPANPEKFPLDKYKLSNDGTYRAFEQHHLRVVYRILQTEIRIIRVPHTGMELPGTNA
jgi:plasmid stabilization system protein ParE